LYEKNADRQWHSFYLKNQQNFFKDRNWMAGEWQELLNDDRPLVCLDAGCGVGNTLFPLLSLNKQLSFVAFDFAASAVEILQRDNRYDSCRIKSFVHDIALYDLTEQQVESNSCDFVVFVFVLSAINPEFFQNIVKRIYR
jgi:SAM-dependent methyltransferase